MYWIINEQTGHMPKNRTDWAAEKEHVKCMEVLKNVREQTTALMFAANNGHCKCVDLL